MNGLFRQLVFLAALSAVPILTWHFVFVPQNERIESVNAEIRERQAKIDSIDQLAASAHDLSEVVEAGHRAINLVESKLPSQQDVEHIL